MLVWKCGDFRWRERCVVSFIDGSEFIRALALTILIGAGVVVYVALALGLKATSLQDLKSSFKK